MAVDMKQMIAETLTGLLERKSVDKVTVKELVDACGISRQAFYYHFQDIMEVIEWITAQSLQEAVTVSLAAPTPQEALKAVILSLRENGRLIRHLMASQRRPEIERLLVHSARTYLGEMIRARASGLSARPADLETAIHFHSYGLVGMLVETLDENRDAETMANQFYGLITGALWSGAGVP